MIIFVAKERSTPFDPVTRFVIQSHLSDRSICTIMISFPVQYFSLYFLRKYMLREVVGEYIGCCC